MAEAENTDSSIDQIASINSEGLSDKNQGTAARLEFEYAPSFAPCSRLSSTSFQDGFENDAATISAGRKESGMCASAPIAQIGLARFTIRTEDQDNHGVRSGLSAV